MNGTLNNHASKAHSPLISISVSISPRLKRTLYITTLTLLFFVAITYTIFRDKIWEIAQQQVISQPPVISQSSPTRGTIFSKPGISAYSFTVIESKTYHLTVRGLTGSHVVINRWKADPPVYSSNRNKRRGPDFDEEIYLTPGEYVLTLVSIGERAAEASIELR